MPPSEKYPRQLTSDERVLLLEQKNREVQERLREGAGSFDAVRQSIEKVHESVGKSAKHLQAQIDELKKPKPVQIWRVIGVLFSIFVVIAGWIWQASRYPDREEFSGFKSNIEEQVRVLRERQTDIRTDGQLIKDSVRRQEEKQTKIEEKLDKALAPPPPRRRR